MRSKTLACIASTIRAARRMYSISCGLLTVRRQFTRPVASLKRGVWHVLLHGCEGGGREIEIVHLHADSTLVPASLGHDVGKVVHGMALCGLHEVIRVADDVLRLHEGGTQCPLCRPFRVPTTQDRRPGQATRPDAHRTTIRRNR